MADHRRRVAERLVAQGIGVTVVDPRWVKPVDPAPRRPGRASTGCVAVRRGQPVVGGVGSRCSPALARRGLSTPVHLHGIPQAFLDHAKRGEVLEGIGLTPDAVADRSTRP